MPTIKDRLVASEMGYKAIAALINNRVNRLVISEGGQIKDIDIEEGLAARKSLDRDLYKMANILSR